MKDVNAYPLTWPQGFPRAQTREAGQFKTTLHKALENVQGSLKRFAVDSKKDIGDLVISSNVSLGAQRPKDPGVAVWFVWDKLQVCIAVDRYSSTEANLQAIHHIIEARRTELRHGTLALVRATFTGFKALPAPPGTHWREILKLSDDRPIRKEDVEAAYRSLATKAHPDSGGSHDAMSALNAARTTALLELNG